MTIPLTKPPSWPMINQKAWSFQSIKVIAKGVTFYGTKSLNYSVELKPDEARGTTALPLGYGLGKGTVSAEIEMYKDWAMVLVSMLGVGFMGVPIDNIIAQYGETGLTQTDSILGARITKIDESHSDGILSAKLTLQPAQILYNGLDPIPIGR